MAYCILAEVTYDKVAAAGLAVALLELALSLAKLFLRL